MLPAVVLPLPLGLLAEIKSNGSTSICSYRRERWLAIVCVSPSLAVGVSIGGDLTPLRVYVCIYVCIMYIVTALQVCDASESLFKGLLSLPRLLCSI